MKSLQATALAVLLALSSTSSVKAAQSSAGAGEIAIYTEATGTDVLTTADLIHDFDTNDREDAGIFTRSGADITLNRAGHYLAIYNSQFNGAPQAGTEERVEIQSYLTLAGAAQPTGWSQGFIRRQQSQLDAVTTGMITSLGPPVIWVDPATSRIYLRHTRRTDFAAIPLTITDQFSRNPGLPFENSALAPTVIATGTGDSGVAIEAVQTEFPLILPTSGGKGRYGRVNVTAP